MHTYVHIYINHKTEEFLLNRTVGKIRTYYNCMFHLSMLKCRIRYLNQICKSMAKAKASTYKAKAWTLQSKESKAKDNVLSSWILETKACPR